MRQAVSRSVEQHPVLVYSVARMALFIAALIPLRLLGVRGLWLFGLAIVLSGLLSLVLLDRVRSQFSGTLSAFFSGLNQRIDEAARSENADAHGSAGPTADGPADESDGPVAEDPAVRRPPAPAAAVEAQHAGRDSPEQS